MRIAAIPVVAFCAGRSYAALNSNSWTAPAAPHLVKP